ncbi:metallophosphoesterase [Paraburkholderia elongata]|uniref:metallophosphoesterase n=1 Tax=Paraburkholderia elongata TaxID=2675747 RepID=UPI001F36C1F3|nr:metallophosphoesterase [Paraburkholderia elongata]
MDYDIIGGVHGHADKLTALLTELGYCRRMGTWRHPRRTAVCVGDFIDRGPHQLDTIDIVRPMVDAGSALAVMGNHEFNAIAWYLRDPDQDDEYLRPRQGKVGEENRNQHAAFLAESRAQARPSWRDYRLASLTTAVARIARTAVDSRLLASELCRGA